jgi:hypothetical protein
MGSRIMDSCVVESRSRNWVAAAATCEWRGRGLRFARGAALMAAHIADGSGSLLALHEALLPVAALEAILTAAAGGRLQRQVGQGL